MSTQELIPFDDGNTGGALPPVLHGSMTPAVAGRVGDFYGSIAGLFEAWVGRRKSEHTRRAYRGDVMAFAAFMGWQWPDDAANLLRASSLDVQAFKSSIGKQGGAGKTINRRISSLSSFYKFLAGAAAELRLPITVPNPAHAQFISREPMTYTVIYPKASVTRQLYKDVPTIADARCGCAL